MTRCPGTTLARPCRRIVFTFESCDQGWGGNESHGKYQGSYTWFEFGSERCNKTAGQDQPSFDVSDLATIYPEVQGTDELAHNHALLAPDHVEIQRNVKADREVKQHRVVWSRTDDIDPESDEAQQLAEIGRGKATGSGRLVRELKLGDIVTVWAKARFPGWVNHVHRAKVDVYWAV